MEKRITIAGRDLNIVFDTAAWVEVEKQFGSLDRMYKRFDEDVLPITAGLHLSAICATSGTCDRHKKDDAITFDWLVKHATPVETQRLCQMARMAVIDGMTTTEKPCDDEEAPVDVGLEEEAAKKTKADA